MRHLGAEQLLDAFDRRQRIFDDVVEQAGGDGDGVQFHVREEVGDGEGMDEIRLAGVAHLAPVLEGGEHVRTPEQLDVGVRAVSADLFQEIFESNHENRCLTSCRTDGYSIIRMP